MRRFLYLLVAFSCSLLPGACGGEGAGEIASGTGAELAPADSLAFISMDTGRPDAQRRLDRLLSAVPALRDGIPRWLLTQDRCSAGLREMLGKTVSVVVLPAATRDGRVVVMTWRKNAKEARQALVRGSAECESAAFRGRASKSTAKEGTPFQIALRRTTRVQNGWLLIAKSRASLDRLQHEAEKGVLAGSRDFESAFAALPKDAFARVYLSGGAVSSALASALGSGLPGLVPPALAKRSPLEWIAVAARPDGDGFRIEGSVSGLEARNAPNALIAKAPAESLLAFSVNGSGFGLEEALSKDGSSGSRLSQLETLLGLGPDDLTALARGEIAAYFTRIGALDGKTVAVDPRSGRIVSRSELALELRTPGAGAVARRIEKRLPALAAFFKGGERRVSVGSLHAEELTLGTLRLYLGTTGGRMFLSTALEITAPSVRLEASPGFIAAAKALAVPARNAGVLYLDLAGARTTAAAGVEGKPPRRSPLLLAYLDASKSTLRIRGVLTAG